MKELWAEEDGGRRDGWWRRKSGRRRDERAQHCGTPAVCLPHICSRLIVWVGCRLVWKELKSSKAASGEAELVM